MAGGSQGTAKMAQDRHGRLSLVSEALATSATRSEHGNATLVKCSTSSHGMGSWGSRRVNGRVRIVRVLEEAVRGRVNGQTSGRGLNTPGTTTRRVNGHVVVASAQVQHLEIHGCNARGGRGGGARGGIGRRL